MKNNNSGGNWLCNRLKKCINVPLSFAKLALGLILNNFVIRFLLRKPNYNKKYAISICGIFKNEAPFLKEWIEYHEMIGVEHFFLYNNNSDDSYKEVLEPYILREVVTLIDWPYQQGQILAYEHFYNTYRHQTQWVSFLDIDEFITPKYDVTLSEWIKKHDRYPVLLIYWKMFGTSNIIEHNYEKLVIEQFFVSWKYYDKVGKCLINTDYDIKYFNSSTHHEPIVVKKVLGLKCNIYPNNNLGRFVKGSFHFGDEKKSDKMDIQINHYWTKGWDVYSRKREMTDPYFKVNPKKDLDYFYYHENRNTSADYTIFRYLIRLKLKIGII